MKIDEVFAQKSENFFRGKPEETADEKKEMEENAAIEKMKEFFVQKLPIPYSKKEGLKKESDLKELFEQYRDFMNADPSFGHFASIVKKHGCEKKLESKDDLDSLDLIELWTTYLIEKLPYELVNNQAKKFNADAIDLDPEIFEKIHEARKKRGTKTILGYHTSASDFVGDSILPSKITTILNNMEIPAGYSYYSTNPEALYNFGYLAFVEGEQSETETHRKKTEMSHAGGNWVATARKLPIIEKFKLNDELIKKLGLKKK